MNEELTLANLAPGELQFSASSGEAVITIKPDGVVLWRGREIETDQDFRSAMMDLAKEISRWSGR